MFDQNFPKLSIETVTFSVSCFAPRGHLEDVYDICWTRDGNFMISGSVDNTAIMWDISKGVQPQLCMVQIFRRATTVMHIDDFFILFFCLILCSGQKVCMLNDHKSYVQGVTWDPQGQYVATLSCDR